MVSSVPTNIDAEQAVLGSILIDPRAIKGVRPILDKPDRFYLPQNRLSYAAMLELDDEDTPSDVVMVSGRLERRGELDAAGGLGYLTSLANFIPTSINAEHYAREVEQAWFSREAVEIGEEAARTGNFDELA